MAEWTKLTPSEAKWLAVCLSSSQLRHGPSRIGSCSLEASEQRAQLAAQ